MSLDAAAIAPVVVSHALATESSRTPLVAESRAVQSVQRRFVIRKEVQYGYQYHFAPQLEQTFLDAVAGSRSVRIVGARADLHIAPHAVVGYVEGGFIPLIDSSADISKFGGLYAFSYNSTMASVNTSVSLNGDHPFSTEGLPVVAFTSGQVVSADGKTTRPVTGAQVAYIGAGSPVKFCAHASGGTQGEVAATIDVTFDLIVEYLGPAIYGA